MYGQMNIMLCYVMNIILKVGASETFADQVFVLKQGERCSGGQRQQ